MGNVLSSGFEAAKTLLFEKANKYIFELEAHLKVLLDEAQRLEAAKLDVENKLEMADRKGLRGDETCKEWISQVKAIQPKVSKLLEDSSVEMERLSMCGFCSTNFFSTYCYGKDVFETLEKVESILGSKPCGVVASMGPPPGIAKITTQRTVGLEEMLEATWRRLMEKEVGILGLWGMGGIGKTTLLKQINQKLLEKKEDQIKEKLLEKKEDQINQKLLEKKEDQINKKLLEKKDGQINQKLLEEKKDEFEVVIFVVVSQNLQVEKIQNEIGERLGICDEAWERKTQDQKTSRIYGVLAKRRFVMLLDDIWRKVELEEEIGIPLPSPENGSKVVFTTRSKYVCGRMGPDDLEVKQLDPENAWELFRQKVRGSTLESDPKILEIAKQICERCDGLPLALNVIGQTMSRRTSVPEWQWAIDVLNTNAANYGEVEDEVLTILKLSYDDLKNERAQQCFQFFALFPEDNLVDKNELVQNLIHEGIINGGGDREKAINEGYKIIGDLISACLLMHDDTFPLKFVTMHDVIRQMALWAASNFGKEEEKVIVKTGAGLHHIPEVRDWNAVRRMSLAKNKIQNISISPVCPNLTTLLLWKNNLVNISGEFFLSMPKLVILDLSCNQNLTKLPEEVSNLGSLRYLDLSGTSLENLPAGLGKLIQLRYLSLINVRTLQSISVIPSLVNIEMLLLHGTTTYLSLELIEGGIKLLKNLKVLGVSINDVVVLKHLLSISTLASCIEYIVMDGVVATDGPLQFETVMASIRYIVIQGGVISADIMEHTRYTSAICFQNLLLVEISEVSGIQDLSWLIFAPNLTAVSVVGPSPELQEIISREKVSGILNEGSSNIVPFRKLHTIILQDLEELKCIYWERLELPSLKSMTILSCPKLKKLPLSKERAYYFDLHEDDEEWFRGLEWEDEVTDMKNRWIHPYYQVALK